MVNGNDCKMGYTRYGQVTEEVVRLIVGGYRTWLTKYHTDGGEREIVRRVADNSNRNRHQALGLKMVYERLVMTDNG